MRSWACSRPGNQTRVILLAVGLGAFFVLGVRALQSNLLDEFSVELDKGGPDMFLIDIQQDQVDRVRAFLTDRAATGSGPPRADSGAARPGHRRARPRSEPRELSGRPRPRLARARVRDHLSRPPRVQRDGDRGRVLDRAGRPAGRRPRAQVSIERSIHERFSIGVGDLMRFDVLGRVVQARVTSVRDVEWEDSRNGGFMFVFRPGPLSAAPHTYIAIIRAPEAPAARAAMQHDLVAAFPNVSAIDVREVARLGPGRRRERHAGDLRSSAASRCSAAC